MVLDEIKSNYQIIKGNQNFLQQFNEFSKVIFELTKDEFEDGKIYILHFDTIQLLKAKFPENKRIQSISPSDTIDAHLGSYTFDYHIDFLLPSFNFSMWEASKTSGALIGADPFVLAQIGEVYTAFEAEMGYSEAEFYRATLSDFNSFPDGKKFLNTTFKLEQTMRMRLHLIDKVYVHAIDLVERAAQ